MLRFVPRSALSVATLCLLVALAPALLVQADRQPTVFVAWAGVGVVAAVSLLWPYPRVVLGLASVGAAVYGLARAASLDGAAGGALVPLGLQVVAAAIAYSAAGLVARICGRGLRALVEDVEYREKVIQELTKRDPETNALKPQYARQLLQEEVERAHRYHRPLSYMVIGIEDWPGLLKRWGEEECRSLLVRLCAIASERLRIMDKVCRHGAAQFALILPETPLIGAKIVGERIIARAESELGITVRAGIVEFPADGEDAEALMCEADAAFALADAAAIPIASRGLLRR